MGDMLNVRAIRRIDDGVLGPGVRVGVWFQGCSIGCPGCMVPELQPAVPYELVDSVTLFERVMDMSGDAREVSISGGEPFEQPVGAMGEFLGMLKDNGFGIWIYSGYTLDELAAKGRDAEIALADCIVDGRYRRELDDGAPLRGSSNQRVIMISDRYSGARFPGTRKMQFSVERDGVSMVGIPPVGFWDRFRERIRKF